MPPSERAALFSHQSDTPQTRACGWQSNTSYWHLHHLAPFPAFWCCSGLAAGVICPQALLQFYGDGRTLRRAYPMMCRFVDFCVQRCRQPGLRAPDTFHCFGDWLNVDDDTPKDLILRAYLVHSLELTAAAAGTLELPDDAARYSQLASTARASYCEDYVDGQGQLVVGSQCAAVLSLAFNLLRDDARAQALASQRLAALVAARDGHLSTGFVGTRDLMRVLSAAGRHSPAYALLHCRTYPSWGFTLDNGATTMWERWDGWTPGKGFQDPGMNSFCHYSFGAVGQWLFETVGGIRPMAPGWQEIRIAPVPDPGALTAAAQLLAGRADSASSGSGTGDDGAGAVRWARLHYDSCRGLIEVYWRLEGGGRLFVLEILVPVNTTAHVVLPGRPLGLLPDGIHSVCPTSGAAGRLGLPGQAAAPAGRGCSSAASATADATDPGAAGAYTVVVGSGHYTFECDMEAPSGKGPRAA